jgi:hypothetical protein
MFSELTFNSAKTCLFQRKAYLEHPGVTFWEKLDNRLASIRKDAGGDPKGVTECVLRLFIHHPDQSYIAGCSANLKRTRKLMARRTSRSTTTRPLMNSRDPQGGH